jgi:uncharacterized protein CbrC (UPF0167 family)
MTTFLDLGIPFPLFEADVTEAGDYLGPGQCNLCDQKFVHCFDVNEVTFIGSTPPYFSTKNAAVCYGCLRAGKAAFTKDTVLGMVTWKEAMEGLTHGEPGLRLADFELIPSQHDPQWMRAKVPSEFLLELVRTPTYNTWQGERWQFCCKRPMIYAGIWKEEEFKKNSPNGNGQELFATAKIDGVAADMWGHLEEIGGPYMFRCSSCGTLRGHYDMD